MQSLAILSDRPGQRQPGKAVGVHVRSGALLCLVAAALSLHCGGNAGRPLEERSTVTIAHPGLGGRGLNPSVADDSRYFLFLPLMRINKSGAVEGALAESWESSDDQREVTYHLRKDVRWQDGVPVTAHDVKFSMDLMTHPDVLIETSVFGSVEVLDDFTLRIRDGAGGVDEVFWPKHLLKDLDPADFYEWDFWKRPIGNGPYRFVQYQPHTMMEFEASEDYFRGKVPIDRATLKFAGDAGLRDLQAGAVDAVVGVSPVDARQFAADQRFNVYYDYAGWWVQQALYWKHENPLFQDAKVRRALTLAIDRRDLLRLVALPEGIPIIDAPYSLRQLARKQFPDPLPYDPEAANALLEEAGWIDGNGDGVREKGELEFHFTALVGHSPAYNRRMAIYLQNQLRKAGVAMEIMTSDPTVVWQKILDGSYEAALGPFVLLDVLLLSLGYENPALAELAHDLYRNQYHRGAEREAELFERVHAIFRRDTPITFLGPRMKASIVHRRIKGLSTPWRADPIFHLEYLWLSDDR